VLRDFEPRDQDAVRDLILRGMAERWGDQFDPGANPDTDDLWSAYVARGAEIVVFEVDGAVVATGALVPEADGAGRIMRMSVDRRHRRNGFARAVLAELIERARRRGFESLLVTTDTPWTDAVALYQSCGFTLAMQNEIATHFTRSP
jgi:GNAT superfamily N-acetyltransferase